MIAIETEQCRYSYLVGRAMAMAMMAHVIGYDAIDSIEAGEHADNIASYLTQALQRSDDPELPEIVSYIASCSNKNWDGKEFRSGFQSQLNIMMRVRFGMLIKFRRQETGLTQQELAKRCGVRRHTISDIEKGRWSAGIDLIQRILNAMDMELQIAKCDSSKIRH